MRRLLCAEATAAEHETLDAVSLKTVMQTVLRADDLSVCLEAIARLRQDAQEDAKALEVLAHIARNDQTRKCETLRLRGYEKWSEVNMCPSVGPHTLSVLYSHGTGYTIVAGSSSWHRPVTR